jgi:uncharacterized repeat protein (TIGR04138 family)
VSASEEPAAKVRQEEGDVGEERNMIEELRRLVRDRRRYPIEAYLFLYEALDVSQKLVGAKRHVSGQELLEGFRRLAVERFGPLALMVLGHWGLRRSEDVGEMVFNLVERGLMGKTETDRPEDFDAVYDFEEAFSPAALLAQADSKALAPSFQVKSRELPSQARATS